MTTALSTGQRPRRDGATLPLLPRKPALRVLDGGRTDDGFTDGSRHGWLAEMCGYLAASIWARDASALLADRDALPEHAAVLTLPVWQWSAGGPSVGRKAKARGGGSLMLPTRIDWHGSSVVIVTAGQGIERSWSAAGTDVTGTGTSRVTVGPTRSAEAQQELTGHLTAGELPRRRLIRELERLVAEGRAARWNAIQRLEPAVNHAVEMAHRQVAFEIAGDMPGAPPVMDPQGLESIKHEMLLGVDDTQPGSVARLWSRMEEPHCFLRADPLLYVRSNLHRDATEGVRRKIGDPKIGAKVRRAYARSGAGSLSEFLVEYRLQFPNDKLAEDRARAALTTRALIPTWVDLVSGDDLISATAGSDGRLWH